MSKKESRISINKLESILKENIITVPMHGCEDVNIVIRRTLPLKDMMQFVTDVVSSCVDTENATYTPEIKEFAFKAAILTTYANFNLPSNVEKQYELVYRTDALEQVLEYIDANQLAEIERAIDAQIDHEVRMMESVLAIKTQEVMSRIDTMVEQFEAAFGGINSEELNGVMQRLAQMDNMTEESIAKAVLGIQSTQAMQADKTIDDGSVLSFPRSDK